MFSHYLWTSPTQSCSLHTQLPPQGRKKEYSFFTHTWIMTLLVVTCPTVLLSSVCPVVHFQDNHLVDTQNCQQQQHSNTSCTFSVAIFSSHFVVVVAGVCLIIDPANVNNIRWHYCLCIM